MNARIKTVLLFFILVFLLNGCSQNTEAYMQDPVSLSGDTAYYAAMDSDLRKTALSMKHIEVSGVISAGGYTTVFVGDEKQDGICFSCTFPQRNDEIASLKEGTAVQLHGVCTGIVGNIIYLEYCQLTSFTPPPENSTTVPPTVITTAPPTTEPTSPPTTEPTTPPTTEPTTLPTITTTPPATEASTVPAVSEGTENMVWIPQSGKKYHINASCSGMKNPTQITKEEAESRGFTHCKKCYS